MQHTRTIKLRIRDKHAKVLLSMATEVNQVWNYCNELSCRKIRDRREFMTGYDLNKYTAGACKEFKGIGSATIQCVGVQYAANRNTHKASRLRWRKSFGKNRSLGWIPFKVGTTRYESGQVKFTSRWFKVWDSYNLSPDIKFRGGSFHEDSRGRWYFSAAVTFSEEISRGQDRIGIDLGLKSAAVCSDGTILTSRRYREYEEKLAMAQRAGRKKQARQIHAKIKNKRNDDQHKFSRDLVNRCCEIVVGDVSSSKLTQTRMAKSVYDAGWSSLKTMLEYKCQQAGVVYKEVNEAYTTRKCSECEALTGPQGLTGLSVREWRCSECGGSHSRDINSAINILNLGARHCAP